MALPFGGSDLIKEARVTSEPNSVLWKIFFICPGTGEEVDVTTFEPMGRLVGATIAEVH